jgi:hypothetical protein
MSNTARQYEAISAAHTKALDVIEAIRKASMAMDPNDPLKVGMGEIWERAIDTAEGLEGVAKLLDSRWMKEEEVRGKLYLYDNTMYREGEERPVEGYAFTLTEESSMLSWTAEGPGRGQWAEGDAADVEEAVAEVAALFSTWAGEPVQEDPIEEVKTFDPDPSHRVERLD